ncbi:MAG: DNA primase small subunit domain-containing protein [Candidatus Nanohaloarchaea archaeon]
MGERERPQDWRIRQYYEQDELRDRVMEVVKYREVAPTYPSGYGKRPDSINFPGDFDQFVQDGAVAFHASVERWQNPLLIDQVSNLDDLRTGWDLVMDIDCDESFSLAKDTAELVVRALRDHDIENVSVKFSGNRGFHIGIRAEAFPDTIGGKDIADLYPELPRAIIDYLREKKLKDDMVELVREHGFSEEMETDEGPDPYQVADIENDWGQRHLFRIPYSLHDGSWLVSKPIDPDRIQEFEKEEAEMDRIEFEHGFLDEYEEGEAEALAINGMDHLEEKREQRRKEKIEKSEREFERPEDAIPEKYFPPTIKNILEGLEDGRKRGLFILINFYLTVGYDMDEIEAKIWEWNERNDEPLRESYVTSQLNWHRKRQEIVPPPNYDANGYYQDMQVYEGDPLEEKVSNPVSYAFRKAKKRGSAEEDDDGEDEVYVCDYCGKEYKSEAWFKKHIRKCNDDLDVKKL